MQHLEGEGLAEVLNYGLKHYTKKTRFKTQDLQHLHHRWLGHLYLWAGQFREVNVSKNGFLFANASEVPRLMSLLEQNECRGFTPCAFQQESDIVRAIAVVHTELILIHPFREGNGRLARVLANLMAAQANLPLIDFSSLADKARFEDYVTAVQIGLGRDYDAMEQIFTGLLFGG